MNKSTGTHTPSLEETKALTNCCNKEINVLKNCSSTSVVAILKCMKGRYPYVQDTGVFGDEFVAHLKSHQRCSAGIRTSPVLPH